MPLLRNARREQFAQFVAAGVTATESYLKAGWSAKTKQIAATGGGRMLKVAEVAARIAELSADAQHTRAAVGWLERNYVLENLRSVYEAAFRAKRFSSALDALRLMGMELGMFRERHELTVWDGDMSKLTEQQMERMLHHFDTIIEQERPELEAAGYVLPPLPASRQISGGSGMPA